MGATGPIVLGLLMRKQAQGGQDLVTGGSQGQSGFQRPAGKRGGPGQTRAQCVMPEK